MQDDIAVMRDGTGNLVSSREIVVPIEMHNDETGSAKVLALRGMDATGPSLRDNIILTSGRFAAPAAAGATIGLIASWLLFNGWQASTIGANNARMAFQLTMNGNVMLTAGLLGLAIGAIGGALAAFCATRLPLAIALCARGSPSRFAKSANLPGRFFPLSWPSAITQEGVSRS